MKIIPLLFFIGAIISCQTPSSPVEAQYRCGEYWASGVYKKTSYTFCSTIPTEISYSYKEGEWKYWDTSGKLIATGTYLPQKTTITGRGGCDYEMVISEFKLKNGAFEETYGPENELIIDQLESCIPIAKDIHMK